MLSLLKKSWIFSLLGIALIGAILFLRASVALGADYDPRNSLIYDAGEPETIDPALVRSGASGVVGDLFSGLVVLDPHMHVRPALAETWELDASGTTYTFHLHPNAKFHNGRAATTADVVFSWERAAAPETHSETVLLYLGDIVGLAEYNAGQADSIRGVEVVDDTTLKVTIDAPKPYFLAKLTYPVSWLVDKENVKQANWENKPNGTGPFRQVKHIYQDIWVLERNPYYYGQMPAVANVVYQMYKGYGQRLYENDDIFMTSLSKDQLSRAGDPADLLYGQIYPEVSLCTSWVAFNTQIAPFDDPLVRQAFVHAFDQKLYMEAITANEDVPAHGVLPPGMPGYDMNAQAPAYDVVLAKQLLAKSSYAGADKLPELVWTVSASGGYTPRNVALIKDMWERNLGVKILVVGIDWYDYYYEIAQGNYGNLLSEGWCADYIDPENFLDVLFHSGTSQNTAGYHSEQFDALVEQARVERNVSERIRLYQQAERLLVEDAPALFLSHYGPGFTLMKHYVKGYTPAPIGVPQNQFMWIER